MDNYRVESSSFQPIGYLIASSDNEALSLAKARFPFRVGLIVVNESRQEREQNYRFNKWEAVEPPHIQFNAKRQQW